MSQNAPVVAELGRPETPQETADRKAASSAAYRSSQTVRNLVVALLVTLAVVVVIVLAVPRGTLAPPPAIDLDQVAAEATDAMGTPVIVPEVSDQWRVNGAELTGGAVTVWTVTLAPSAQEERGFVRIAQAFNADVTWASLTLGGMVATGSVEIDGRVWDEFVVRTPEQNGNVSYAIGTAAGADYLLLYGALTPAQTQAIAETLDTQIAARDAS